MSATTDRNMRRTLSGIVMSSSMDKTISVQVERRYKHAKYGKYLRHHVKYLAHDEENQARPGDTVELAECRPLSKRKRWRLVNVVMTAEAADAGGEA